MRRSRTQTTCPTRSIGSAARTDQPTPSTPGGYARTVFDSLALKYRLVIRDLQSVIERPDRAHSRHRRRLAERAAQPADRRCHRPAGRCGAGRSDRARQRRRADARDRRGRIARRGARHHRSIVSDDRVHAARRRTHGTVKRRAFSSIADSSMPDTTALKHLKDLWDDRTADRACAATSCRCFAIDRICSAPICASRTSAEATRARRSIMPDPFTGAPVRVLAVKGSGGDLGSITDAGFALLYLDKLEQLKARYRGEAFEDEMVGLLSARRIRPQPGRGIDRYAAARVSSRAARRPPAPGLGHRAGGVREWQTEARGIQSPVRPAHHLGAVAAARASSSPC